MSATKSAKKKVGVNKKKRIYNIKYKNKIKTSIKECKQVIISKQLDKAKEVLLILIARVDKAASKGVIHKKTASRKKSRLTRKVNQLQSLTISKSNTNSGENFLDLKSSSA